MTMIRFGNFSLENRNLIPASQRSILDHLLYLLIFKAYK